MLISIFIRLVIYSILLPKNMQHKKTILEQAYEKVNGFAQFHEKLRQKLSITGRAESTSNNYCNHIAKISLHFKQLPTTLSIEEIESYLFYLQQKYKTPSDSFFKHTVYSLRFVFKMEGMTGKNVKLPSIKHKRKLPIVLSKEEIIKLLNSPRQYKHRILIALLYGCGLRCFEVRNVKITDLDLYRSTLHVRQGKGNKDRYVPLGNFLVKELKSYLRFTKPSTWLFDSKETEKKRVQVGTRFSQTGVRWVVKSAAKRAGIHKKINVHTLRHSFATHLLEDGLDIVSIKELLGHSKIETTMRYLHVAKVGRKLPYSPIDNLEGVRIFEGLQYKLNFASIDNSKKIDV